MAFAQYITGDEKDTHKTLLMLAIYNTTTLSIMKQVSGTTDFNLYYDPNIAF